MINDDDIFRTKPKKQKINENQNIISISDEEAQNSKDFSLDMSNISSISKDSDSIEISENIDHIIIQQYKDINTSFSVMLNNSVYNHEYQIKVFSNNYIFKLLSKGSPNEKSILLKPHINKRLIIFPIKKDGIEIKLIILNNYDKYYFIEVCDKNNNMCNNIYNQLSEYIFFLLTSSLIKIWTKIDCSLIFAICNKNVSIFNYYVYIIFKLIDNFGYYYSDKKDLGKYLELCGKNYHYNMNKVISFIEQIKRGIIPKLLSNEITYIDPQ